MFNAKAVTVPIARNYERAYDILKRPENFPLWSPVLEARFEPRGNNGLDWLVDLPTGTSILRFSEPNDYGVLDYTILDENGSFKRYTALRLLPNEDGCELVAVFFQQPHQDDEAFTSYVDWAWNDFMALKSVVETL